MAREAEGDAAAKAAVEAKAAAAKARKLEKKVIEKKAAEKKAAEAKKADVVQRRRVGAVHRPDPGLLQRVHRQPGDRLRADAQGRLRDRPVPLPEQAVEQGKQLETTRPSNSSSGAYGIPQALPGSKMASEGSDWQTNPATQIKWGLGYIEGRYGSPCKAWSHSQSVGLVLKDCRRRGYALGAYPRFRERLAEMRPPATMGFMAYGIGEINDDAATKFGTVAFYASLGRAFVTMCAVIPFLFLIEVIDIGARSGYLDVAGGIIPHRLDGLDGVLFSPFLHAGWDHLYGNSVPLILVGTFALAGGARRFICSTG